MNTRADQSTSNARHAAHALRCGLVVPSLGNGGLEEVVAMLAVELPRHGVEASVLCTHGGGPVAERLMAGGIPVTVAGGSSRKWRGWMKTLRPDVLSTHFISRKSASVLAAWAPYVETIHNTNVWLSARAWTEERAKCAAASALVAVSDVVAAYHRRVCGQHPALSVIPNGVQGTRVVGLPKMVARDRLGLTVDDVVIVDLARFCIQKNQLGLVDALADVLIEDDRARLLLVGGMGDDTYANRVVLRAGDLIDRRVVRVMPHLPNAGLVLSAADFFVSNAFFEGWSLAATEALWLGRPVILSDCGGSRELVGDGGSRGILIPNPGGDPASLEWHHVTNPDDEVTVRNHAALRSAVRSMLANRQEWEDRADATRREAQANWSAQRMAKAYATVLRRAAGLSQR